MDHSFTPPFESLLDISLSSAFDISFNLFYLLLISRYVFLLFVAVSVPRY
jgi:hypothetical protein